MSSRMLAVLRRAGAVVAVTGGVALVAGSVSGIARLDGTLAAEAERAATPRVLVTYAPPRGSDCPLPEERRTPRVTY